MLKETLIFVLKQLFMLVYSVCKPVFNTFFKWGTLAVTKNTHPSKHILKAISFINIVKPTFKKNTVRTVGFIAVNKNVPQSDLNKLSLTKKIQALSFKTPTNGMQLKGSILNNIRFINYKANNITSHYKPKPKLVYC